MIRFVVAGLVVAIMALIAAYFLGLPAYRGWRQKRMINMATVAAARGDEAQALLAFRSALRVDPSNAAALAEFAKFCEARQPAQAIGIWERIAELQQESAEPLYHAAGCALGIGDVARARRNLERVSASDRESDTYKLLNARTLIAENHPDAGEKSLIELVALRGSGGEAEFELDHFRFTSKKGMIPPEAVDRMRKRAESENPYTARALRDLISVETAGGQYDLAASDAGKLHRRADATAADQLQFLQLEILTKSLSMPMTIEASLQSAVKHPEMMEPTLAVLEKWGLTAGAARWLNNRPEAELRAESIRKPRIMLALANQDFQQVYALLAEGDQSMPAARIAELRQIQREFDGGQSQPLERWTEFVKNSKGDVFTLLLLQSFAKGWGWTDAQEMALWALTDARPFDPQPWQQLISLSLAKGDTLGALKAATGLNKAAPSLRRARTLVLALNFLLGWGDLSQMVVIAEADAAQFPDNDVQLIYGALLAKLGRNDEALVVADRMAAGNKLDVEDSIFLGYIYATLGKTEKARTWLPPEGTNLDSLLPEERQLAKRSTELVADADLQALRTQGNPSRRNPVSPARPKEIIYSDLPLTNPALQQSDWSSGFQNKGQKLPTESW